MMEYKNTNPFKVPGGYFGELEEGLLKKTKLNYNAYGYKTSKDYFNKLENQVLTKTLKISKFNKHKIFKRTLFIISGVAASFILFYEISSTFFFKPIAVFEKEEVTENYIETYYLEEFNSYEILSMLDEDEIKATLSFSSKPYYED